MATALSGLTLQIDRVLDEGRGVVVVVVVTSVEFSLQFLGMMISSSEPSVVLPMIIGFSADPGAPGGMGKTMRARSSSSSTGGSLVVTLSSPT